MNVWGLEFLTQDFWQFMILLSGYTYKYTYLFDKFQYAYDSHPDGGLCIQWNTMVLFIWGGASWKKILWRSMRYWAPSMVLTLRWEPEVPGKKKTPGIGGRWLYETQWPKLKIQIHILEDGWFYQVLGSIKFPLRRHFYVELKVATYLLKSYVLCRKR